MVLLTGLIVCKPTTTLWQIWLLKPSVHFMNIKHTYILCDGWLMKTVADHLAFPHLTSNLMYLQMNGQHSTSQFDQDFPRYLFLGYVPQTRVPYHKFPRKTGTLGLCTILKQTLIHFYQLETTYHTKRIIFELSGTSSNQI